MTSQSQYTRAPAVWPTVAQIGHRSAPAASPRAEGHSRDRRRRRRRTLDRRLLPADAPGTATVPVLRAEDAPGDFKENQEDLLALAALVDAGKVTPVVGRTHPLVEAADAIRELERGHARGKIVVTV